MRRLAVSVIVLVLIPSVASATELEELLERGREASYTAEQVISCSTPDGIRDALVRIEQAGSEIRVGAGVATDAEIAVGAGGWALLRHGGVVEEANIAASDALVESPYLVENLGTENFMGRDALAYRLIRDGVLRAELVFDEETGALVRAVTFDAAGDTYCDRRFVSFDAVAPELPIKEMSESAEVEVVEPDQSVFPDSAAGFTRLDQYADADGFRFAYYSDGFFSFAVFEAPTRVGLTDATRITLDLGAYERVFTAGQAIYAWETAGRGMALVGDLPPDLHEAVLVALPAPTDPGLFRRLWRSLFG